MITILSHDEWKLHLYYSWSLTWVIRGVPEAVVYIDYYIDVSADPGTENQIDSDYFYPDQASSFNAQQLTDGYLSYRTHVWHDLVHLKVEGVIPGLDSNNLPHPSKVPSSYVNLAGGKGRNPGSRVLGGSKPLWYTQTIYYELWSKREYTNLWFILYWPWYYNCFVVLRGETPNTFKEGYIVDQWATHPTFVPSRSGSVRLTCYCKADDGKFRRKDFTLAITFHYTWTGSDYQRYLSGLCFQNIAEWRRATMSTSPSDPNSWSSYFNPTASFKGSTVDFSKPDFYEVKNRFFPDINRVNWHELAAEAYQDLGMADINGIANLKELTEMGGAVMSFAKTLKSLPAKRVKAAASAWLAVHYGFKLTILDAQELYSVLNDFTYRRSSLSKAQAGGSTQIGYQTYEHRYQVFFDVFAQLRSVLLQCVAISDAFPTLENAWDMVPWSFVIDWFVDLGSVLQSLDNWFNLRQRHEVVAVGRSVKSSRMVNSNVFVPGSDVNLDISYYAREYTKDLVSPSIIPSVTINPFNHLVEAAALIISIK